MRTDRWADMAKLILFSQFCESVLTMTRPSPHPLCFFPLSVIILVHTILYVRSNLHIPSNKKSNFVTAFCSVFLSVLSCYLVSSLPRTPLIKFLGKCMNISAVALKVYMFFWLYLRGKFFNTKWYSGQLRDKIIRLQ
jgi:hypothetical protein